jgi:glycosyltransferase involved in cell wall biosynthesis
VIIKDSNNAKAYASAVIRVLTDSDHRQKLIEGGRDARQKYSIEEMARRFADGIEEALK